MIRLDDSDCHVPRSPQCYASASSTMSLHSCQIMQTLENRKVDRADVKDVNDDDIDDTSNVDEMYEAESKHGQDKDNFGIMRGIQYAG